jgi:hypothetical protein
VRGAVSGADDRGGGLRRRGGMGALAMMACEDGERCAENGGEGARAKHVGSGRDGVRRGRRRDLCGDGAGRGEAG